jgi:hypothetical protein
VPRWTVAGAILNAGRVSFEDETAPVGVDESMTLAPLDLLAVVIAARPAGLGRLDAWPSMIAPYGAGFSLPRN